MATNLVIDDNLSSDIKLSATQIGERFKISAKKVNQLLNELGWIDKDAQGWNVTGLGLTAGGTQKADATSKQRFVIWHESIVKNKRLKQTISEFLGKDAIAHSTDHSISSFRQKFEAKHRTLDGHYVHSTGELVIDNWLYMNGIVHAYNRPLPIEHDVVSDFYLPVGKVYLQYFATDSGAMTEEQITKIRMSYQGNGLNLIEVYLQDIDKLDEVLPKKLRKVWNKSLLNVLWLYREALVPHITTPEL